MLIIVVVVVWFWKNVYNKKDRNTLASEQGKKPNFSSR
jgi:hypothetical protein